MARYKLSTGLCTVKEEPNFDTDREAWEYLRQILPGKYATLYREYDIEVAHNDEENYVQKWNAKYGPRPLGYGRDSTIPKEVGVNPTYNVWIPILEGITDHSYKVN